MAKNLTLGELMKLAEQAADSAAEAREEALSATVKGCRLLEQALVDALDGEPLRGLPHIGSYGVKLYAARIRAKINTKIPDPEDRGRFLAIAPNGQLTVYYWDAGGNALCEAPATDEDLRIDDLDGLVRTLREVLPYHCKKARGTASRYRRVQLLAQRIEKAIGEE